MKVLVSGAAGRVGANVVRRLVGMGIDVKAMIVPRDPLAAKLQAFPAVEIVEADLHDQASVDAACRGVTHVVHLAAQLVRGSTPIDKFYDVNSFGVLRLLEGALREGAGLERFVLASTEGTYCPGAPPAIPLTEDVRQEPGEYYGTSKLLGEIILRNHAVQFDIPFSIVRFPTVVSPEEADKIFRLKLMRGFMQMQAEGRSNHLWPLFHGQPNLLRILDDTAGNAAEDTAVGFVGPDGAPWTMSMVDVRDAADGTVLALLEPGALGRAFNIAAADATSFVAGASYIAEMYGVPQVTVKMPTIWRLEMSIEAARKHLGFEPKHDYRSMLNSARAAKLADADTFIPANSRSGVGALV